MYVDGLNHCPVMVSAREHEIATIVQFESFC